MTPANVYYGFYEGFIPKIVLVSGCLLFIYISNLLKVLGSDTEIPRYLCQCPYLKLLADYHKQSMTILCLILFLLSACNNLVSVNRNLTESYYSTGFSVSTHILSQSMFF